MNTVILGEPPTAERSHSDKKITVSRKWLQHIPREEASLPLPHIIHQTEVTAMLKTLTSI